MSLETFVIFLQRLLVLFLIVRNQLFVLVQRVLASEKYSIFQTAHFFSTPLDNNLLFGKVFKAQT